MSLPMGTRTCGRRFRRAFSTKSSVFVPWVPETFHARFPLSVLKSDQHEKPLDQSAIPLIAPSQLQPRLYQNILRRSRLRPTRVGCTKLPVAREKKPLVPRVRFLRRDRHISTIDLRGNATNKLTEPQRRQNREKKSNMLNKQNNNSERTCSTLFGRFLCLHHTRLTLSNLIGKAIRSSL